MCDGGLPFGNKLMKRRTFFTAFLVFLFPWIKKTDPIQQIDLTKDYLAQRNVLGEIELIPIEEGDSDES